MVTLKIEFFAVCQPRHPSHHLGQPTHRHQTLFSIKWPFAIHRNDSSAMVFDISIDTIDSDILFFIRLSTVTAMQAKIHISLLTFGPCMHDVYKRIKLDSHGVNLYLPLKLQYAWTNNTNCSANRNRHQGSQYLISSNIKHLFYIRKTTNSRLEIPDKACCMTL